MCLVVHGILSFMLTNVLSNTLCSCDLYIAYFYVFLLDGSGPSTSKTGMVLLQHLFLLLFSHGGIVTVFTPSILAPYANLTQGWQSFAPFKFAPHLLEQCKFLWR